MLGVFRGKAWTVPFETRKLLGQRRFLVGEPDLAALSCRDPLLLLGDGTPPLLHELDEVGLDGVLRTLRLARQRGELWVVSLPPIALEELFGLLDPARGHGGLDIGEDARDLVLRPQIGDALTLLGREYDVEAAVEREEHRRRHAREEHHPQNGILGDDADCLDIRSNDVGLGEHRHQSQCEQE